MKPGALAGYSACIEMLFVPEAAGFAERIRRAADAGFDTIEFWGTANKDIAELAEVATAANVKVGCFFVEPSIALADPGNHGSFLASLAKAIGEARALGCTTVGYVPGNKLPGVPLDTQRAAIVSCLRQAAEMLRNTGIVLVIEPINTGERKDGFIHTTREGLDIVDAVDRPEVKLVYDIYHSAWMGERLQEVLAGRVDRLAHVHLSDNPGRHEPGTGIVPWREGLAWLRSNGYRGKVGLEYQPLHGTVEGLNFIA